MTRYVKKGGNLVLTCRTGHQDRQGHLWEARFAEPIYDLIGAEIEFYDLLMPQAPDTVEMEGKGYEWTTWGEILKPLAGTETWAVYQGDYYAGKPAVIFRRLGKGTVTYVGVDTKTGDMEKEVLKKLYALLKLPVQDYPEGVLVEYRDGLGIAVNYSDKDYTISLPEGTPILIGSRTIPTTGVTVWKSGE